MRGRYSSRAAMAEEACGNQETEDETTLVTQVCKLEPISLKSTSLPKALPVGSKHLKHESLGYIQSRTMTK